MASSLKGNAKDCLVKEQIVEDLLTGLTLQFESTDNYTILRIFGDSLEFGNRSLFFAKDGTFDGTETTVSGKCKPTWPTEIE